MSKALENIFHEHYSHLCNYASVRIKDTHIAEDIVQTVFIQLWENQKLLTLDNPASYLLQCVKYKCIDHHRSKKSAVMALTGELPDISLNPNQEITDDDVEPLLHYFASKLPPKTRAVFLLSRQNGFTYKEISEELNVSLKTVENQMGNALKKMRDLLKKHSYLSYLLFFLK